MPRATAKRGCTWSISVTLSIDAPTVRQQKSLVAQLALFKERLLAIDTRNPSLLFRREAAARCFDLSTPPQASEAEKMHPKPCVACS